ncbi:MAG TPA: sugar phosphate isomerase/epimerase family protein [Candidatus Anammoximicrobium sp.]|nr:sugar phosphate isomerase/epimerase family protein [Candidatus Anammoximicrobium sp.]
MNLSRRQMLQLTAGAAATSILGTRWAQPAGAAAEKKIPIGLELWSVRQLCEKQLPMVLKAVGQMGYDAVELAHSYYGYDAAAWRKLLDENGLKSCGMHMGLPALQGENFQKTVEMHKVIGTPYLIVASLPHKSLASMAAIVETGKQFNELAEKLKPHGMQIGYHCHGGDFAKVEGRTAWELFGENTNADVLLQLDIGNCLGGGGDAIGMLRKFPGRSVSIHIKDHGGKPGAVFGEGTVNWKEVFEICETTGGTELYIIEEEGRAGPEALEDVRRALQNFRKMGK